MLVCQGERSPLEYNRLHQQDNQVWWSACWFMRAKLTKGRGLTQLAVQACLDVNRSFILGCRSGPAEAAAVAVSALTAVLGAPLHDQPSSWWTVRRASEYAVSRHGGKSRLPSDGTVVLQDVIVALDPTRPDRKGLKSAGTGLGR